MLESFDLSVFAQYRVHNLPLDPDPLAVHDAKLEDPSPNTLVDKGYDCLFGLRRTKLMKVESAVDWILVQ